MDPIRQAKTEVMKTSAKMAVFAFKNFPDPSAQITPADAFIMISMGQVTKYMKITWNITHGLEAPDNRRCLFY